jgi:hypothetical protein
MNTTTVDRFNVASDDLILEELVYSVKHDLGISICEIICPSHPELDQYIINGEVFEF